MEASDTDDADRCGFVGTHSTLLRRGAEADGIGAPAANEDLRGVESEGDGKPGEVLRDTVHEVGACEDRLESCAVPVIVQRVDTHIRAVATHDDGPIDRRQDVDPLGGRGDPPDVQDVVWLRQHRREHVQPREKFAVNAVTAPERLHEEP